MHIGTRLVGSGSTGILARSSCQQVQMASAAAVRCQRQGQAASATGSVQSAMLHLAGYLGSEALPSRVQVRS